MTACMWILLLLLAIDLPGGKPGIGFDDLQYSPRLHKVLAPGGRSGKLYLIDPKTNAVTSIGGFSTAKTFEGGHDVGVTSVADTGSMLAVTDRTSGELMLVTGDKILVNLPTFSPYHEFARPDTQVVYNLLPKDEDFRFDPGEYLEKVRREQPDTVVLINPNNPDGGYIPFATLVAMLEEMQDVPNVIVDESFIHFACEGDDYAYRSLTHETHRFPNLMVVKSMSKDFGVAGIRAGYAVMSPDRVKSLLDNGFLWNSSGLAEYFFDLYSRPEFQVEYERKRVHYIRHSRRFFKALASMPGIHAYPTHANFMLIELKNGMTAEDLVCRLLVRRGIYARACDDKKGLEPGKFIRVASRTRSENRFVLRGFKDALR